LEKSEEKIKAEISKNTQFDILSKKIVCKFFNNSLFTRLAIIDYEGRIEGQGDAVRMIDLTEITVDHAIPIEEVIDPAIFKDIITIDLVTAMIASRLKAEVEKTIIEADNDLIAVQVDAMATDKIPPPYVSGRLYFVCQVVSVGGFEPKGLGMKFVYGFKIA
jgi:hypothetical protein